MENSIGLFYGLIDRQTNQLKNRLGLKNFVSASRFIDINFWYKIWDFVRLNSKITVDIIRLLCESLKIECNRIENCSHLFYLSFVLSL
jgi:hypothetical protein